VPGASPKNTGMGEHGTGHATGAKRETAHDLTRSSLDDAYVGANYNGACFRGNALSRTVWVRYLSSSRPPRLQPQRVRLLPQSKMHKFWQIM